MNYFKQIYFQDTLVQVLQILLKSKLLVTDDDDNDLLPSSQLALFTQYKKYVLGITKLMFIYRSFKIILLSVRTNVYFLGLLYTKVVVSSSSMYVA